MTAIAGDAHVGPFERERRIAVVIEAAGGPERVGTVAAFARSTIRARRELGAVHILMTTAASAGRRGKADRLTDGTR